MRPSVTNVWRGRGRRPREAISSREGCCLFAWEIILSATHVVKTRTGLSSEMLMTLFFFFVRACFLYTPAGRSSWLRPLESGSARGVFSLGRSAGSLFDCAKRFQEPLRFLN